MPLPLFCFRFKKNSVTNTKTSHIKSSLVLHKQIKLMQHIMIHDHILKQEIAAAKAKLPPVPTPKE